MYIALFNVEMNNIGLITNTVTNASAELTKRAYEFSTCILKGYLEEELQDAIFFTLNEDNGKQIYSAFIDEKKKNNNTAEIKSSDYRELLDTEILIDFSASFPYQLSDFFTYIMNQAIVSNDTLVQLIPIEVVIPEDLTDIRSVFGDPTGQIFTSNAYRYILPLLKYYGYIIDTEFDFANKKIKYIFRKGSQTHKIKLADFEHDFVQSEKVVNKAVAGTNDGVTSKYYYLDKDNNIVESDDIGNMANRYYPVKAKYFLEEYLADAQYKAIQELANNRYVDNIMLDANTVTNPIDLSNLDLMDFVEVYAPNYVKSIPVSEKTVSISNSGRKYKVKLGFKKNRLTEIISDLRKE